MYFKEIAKEWLRYKKNRIKESTYCNYLFKIEKYLFPEIGNKDIATMNDYNHLIEKLLQYLSPKTVRDIMAILKSILTYYEEEYETSLKIKKLSLPKQEKSRIKVFTQKEKEKIEKYCMQEKTLKGLGIIICLNTGLRIGEICALKWENINFEEKLIYVKKTLQRVYIKDEAKSKIVIDKPKSEASVRVIPMNRKIFEMLKYLRKDAKEQDYVLSGSSENFVEPRNYQHYFKMLLHKNKMQSYKFHILRHTFATNCMEVGMDMKSLSEILGHSNVNITLNIYVHSSNKMKKKFLEKL